MSLTYTAGSLVAARGREWVVLPESAPDMLVLRPLGGSEDDIAAVFPTFEEVRPAEFAAPSPADLGDQRAAGLLRTALRIGFRSGAGPFRSLASIAVEPRAYQLVPLLMALRQRTVRLLISDDVGIGKTVEAGLIAKELLAQGEATRLAVLCSPALAEQWQGELREKFSIDAELVLASTVSRLERGLELGQSLFDKHPCTIISTDFIKSTRHREDFVRHCPDLVIVDEAHACVAADDTAQGGASSAANQLRYELLRRISAKADRHLLLLTATPHSGKESAFRNLLGLVRPELATLDLESPAGRAKLAEHFVARKRADVRDYLTKEDGLADDSLAERTAFPSDRWTKDEPYKLTPAYRALLDDAIAYARDRVTAAGEQGKREARIAWWSVIALLRSMVSSPAAAAQTLKTRSESATARTAQEADALGAPVAADSAENDRLEGMDVAPGAAESEEAGARLLELAERAAQLVGPAEDAKLKALTRHLKGLIADGYHPIVFCRYIPTAEYLATQLEGKLGKRTKIAAVTGTLSPQQRLERIEQLAAESDASGEEAGDPAVRRVLIATDCLSEGVNLQHHFDAVVHYDLAWNPTRHDQREGRVDRYGQKRDQVRVITMYGEDNGIDGKVLEVLFKKHRQIKKDLGISVSVPDETASGVTDAVVEWLLLHGRQGSQESLFDLDGHQESFDRVEREWNSAAEREKTSRSKYAQRAIHPEEVAREVTAVRAALGGADEVRGFALEALRDLDALVREPPDGTGDFTAQAGGAPAGLRDALAATLGGRLIEEDREIPFRTTPAIARGEVALVRTDPAIGAIASYVLDSALDANTPGPRPARRCGVVTTDAVTIRTTLLLVRYRFHLTLPSRTGERQLVAEDARLLAYEGMPSRARWLDDDAAAALLAARAAANTHEQLARNQITRALDGLPDLSAHLTEYGTRLAAELDASHRRVRKANEEIVRGLKVVPQEPADVLGVYVYLPQQPVSISSGAEA
ncbi:ATP-dependent helicase HepA [Streptomyces spinoverrucosus]|uniref:ATP-dependent helicase HepA n=1 Tax=Streptomyces spinoverrucosus TaxID=284043 RepID=A0A4Y3VDN8_9ACTN|nr:DEAD/DEAH box helicase [Streptomyces spinoverrucosus]GEC03701.1 ATP-dependent helicase HepA [Streptomyces spinoverrucosus]GHB50772.1 ATP-dependent helicase HepA [Streptomyces spinoverrucosus]